MTISTATTIKATPEKVWDRLLHFEDYPNWNPFIILINGTPKKGNKLHVQIGGMVFRPTVLEHEPAKELRWLGSLWFKGLFDGEHIFSIRKISHTQVLFEQKEHFKGILVPFFKNKLQRDTKAGFEAMNKALKLQCEVNVPKATL